MNHIVNQSNIRIISLGSEDSHIRNKTEFNITLPKLIQRINNSKAWSDITDTSIDNDLRDICEDDKIPLNKISKLVKTAYFYYISNILF